MGAVEVTLGREDPAEEMNGEEEQLMKKVKLLLAAGSSLRG